MTDRPKTEHLGAQQVPLTLKNLSVSLGIVTASLVIVQALLSYVFLPVIVQASVRETRALLDKHEMHGHPASVSRNELSLILRQMDGLATKESVEALNDRLARIERELSRIGVK